jgi:hypothetical protein
MALRSLGDLLQAIFRPARFLPSLSNTCQRSELRLLRVDAHFFSTGERTVTNWARPPKL